MRLVVLPDAGALAERAAAEVARSARSVGQLTIAFSGGSTPRLMLEHLAGRGDVDWASVEVFQVDERLALDGDPARNMTMLQEALLDHVEAAAVHPMPVDGGPADYADVLPAALGLVQLGLGEDGHTASLVPGDPVLAIDDRDVGLTAEYRGHVRMTLTYPALARADRVLWLVSGAAKADALQRLLVADPTIPAGRVARDRALVLADRAAMGA